VSRLDTTTTKVATRLATTVAATTSRVEEEKRIAKDTKAKDTKVN